MAGAAYTPTMMRQPTSTSSTFAPGHGIGYGRVGSGSGSGFGLGPGASKSWEGWERERRVRLVTEVVGKLEGYGVGDEVGRETGGVGGSRGGGSVGGGGVGGTRARNVSFSGGGRGGGGYDASRDPRLRR